MFHDEALSNFDGDLICDIYFFTMISFKMTVCERSNYLFQHVGNLLIYKMPVSHVTVRSTTCWQNVRNMLTTCWEIK